jgi:hypothetical protein
MIFFVVFRMCVDRTPRIKLFLSHIYVVGTTQSIRECFIPRRKKGSDDASVAHGHPAQLRNTNGTEVCQETADFWQTACRALT